MKATCLYCEKEYETKRETSCYCSNSCRTGAYKLRKKNKQIEAERQIAAKSQKEIDDQQKLIDDELRKQKAEKRRLAKEEKSIKTASENFPNTETIINQESVTSEPDIQTEDEQKLPENPVQKVLDLWSFKDIQKEQENKRIKEEIIQNANRKVAGWIILGGIGYKILESIFKPPKKNT